MPNYPKLTWEDKDLVVSMRPPGIRGWWGFRKMMPYLAGDVLRLNLFVDRTKKDAERQFDYTWLLIQHFPSGEEKVVQVCKGTFISSPHRKVKFPSGTARIITPGNYTVLLELRTGTSEEYSIMKQTMVIITALAGDIWRTDIALKVLIGVIGGSAGALLTLLITAFGNSGG